MLNVNHMAAEAVYFQVQNIGVEIPVRIQSGRHQSPMGKSLRHVTASGKALFRINLFPMRLFDAAELSRRGFFPSKVFITFDFPAIGTGLYEITGIGTVAPGRFADRAKLVSLFMRSQ